MKFCLKKIICMIIAIQTVVQIPIFAENLSRVYAFESFEDYVTNDVQNYFDVNGPADVIIHEDENKNKSVMINKKALFSSEISKQIEGIEGDVIFQLDVKIEGEKFPWTLSLSGKNGRTITPISVDENGNISTGDGKKYGMAGINKQHNFAILYSPEVKRYTVWIDGRVEISDWCLEDSAFDIPNSFTVSMGAIETGDSKVYIDNLKIYNGTSIKNNITFQKKKYNSKYVEYKEKIILETNNIQQARDFTSGTGGNVNSKGNIGEIRHEDGNSFLHFEETTTSDCFIDYVDGSGLGTEYYTVYSVDVRSSKYSGNAQLFTFKIKPDNAFCHMLTINKGGDLVTYSGQKLAKLQKDKWYNISVAVDFLLKRFDVYVDYEKIAEKIPMQLQKGNFLSLMRFYLPGGSGNTIDIDNVLVYYGKEARKIIDENSMSGFSLDTTLAMWDTDKDAKSLIGAGFAYDAISGNVYFDGEKILKEENGAFIENKIIYLPLIKTADRIGKKVEVDENKYICEGVTVEVDSNVMKLKEGSIILSAPVVEKSGVVYAPVDMFSENGFCGEKIFYNDRGLVVFGKSSFDDEEESKLVNFMHFERPTAQKIKEDFSINNSENSHPRVLMNGTEFDRLIKTINADDKAKAMYDNIKKQYSNIENLPVMTYTLANGDRLLPVSEEILKRVLTLSLIYKIDGEEKYAKRAYDELQSAASFPDWHPSHFLDTARMVQAFAIGYDWLYDYMSDEQKVVLEDAMVNLGLREYLRRYTTKEWWSYAASNWGTITNGGAIMMALALMDKYPDECSSLLEIAIKGMENAIYEFGPDGASYEGTGYFQATLECFCLGVQSLKTSLDSDYGLSTSSGFEKVTDWSRAMAYKDVAFAYAENTGGSQDHRNGMWLGYYYDEPRYQKIRMESVRKGLSTEQIFEVYDLMWYVPDYANYNEENNLTLDSMYRNAEVASTRSSWSDDAMFLAYKGGSARHKGHEHMDFGTFSLYLNGICWANDYGYDNYNGTGYYEFTDKSKPNRWSYYRTNTQGHNCIVINPDEDVNPQDWQSISRITRFESKEKGSIGVVDLSDAYSHKADKYIRGYMLSDDRRSTTIRDEISLKGSNNEIYWFMHTGISGDENFEINGNSAVITHESGEKLYLEFATNAQKYELYTMNSEFLPSFKNAATDMWAVEGKKLVIKLVGSGDIDLTVKMYDNDLAGILPRVSNETIDEWSIPDGELTNPPLLTGIYQNNQLLEDFNANKNEYNLYCYMDQEFPKVTASASENCKIQITHIEEKNEYRIKVVSVDDESFSRKYVVKLSKIPYTYETLEGFTRLKPVNITASRVPEVHNPPQNVDDGSFESRFAVDGDNEWVQLDYGSVVTADAFAVAYYMGTERTSYYDILISEDGINYTTIFEGETSGISNFYELYKTGTIKLRYLKLVGHKNSAGDWNSPTEIALLVTNK